MRAAVLGLLLLQVWLCGAVAEEEVEYMGDPYANAHVQTILVHVTPPPLPLTEQAAEATTEAPTEASTEGERSGHARIFFTASCCSGRDGHRKALDD